jgi:hypothetical protein
MASDVLAQLEQLEKKRANLIARADRLKWGIEKIQEGWKEKYGTDDPEEIQKLVDKKAAKATKLQLKLQKQITKLEAELDEYE